MFLYSPVTEAGVDITAKAQQRVRIFKHQNDLARWTFRWSIEQQHRRIAFEGLLEVFFHVRKCHISGADFVDFIDTGGGEGFVANDLGVEAKR